MKRTKLAVISIYVLILACNLPVGAATTQSSGATPTATSTQIITTDTPTSKPVTNVVPTITPTLPPPDVPFEIDCSAMPANRKNDCDYFIRHTREIVYPKLREVTGGSLATCYKSMKYVILPRDPSAHAGGLSAGDRITLNAAYSIDLRYKYDIHELLHSVSTCEKALDDHVFTGLILNYVYGWLGVNDAGYFFQEENEREGLNYLINVSASAKGNELADACRGILQREVTLYYFHSAELANIRRLYRTTIQPEAPGSPNPIISTIWGSNAIKVEALLRVLEGEMNYPLDIPQCGL